MDEQAVKFIGTRTIVYCRSAVSDDTELKKQEKVLKDYAKENGLSVHETFLEGGKMDSLTYHSWRLRAKYREFDNLLITELNVLGNSPIEITHEIGFLNQKGVKVISLKDGELNADTLPQAFRKGFRLIGHNS